MSVLETPRIMFHGQVTWDPIVTNNGPDFYNEATSESVMTPGETAQVFRDAAIAAVDNGGNWNPHGTHRSTFFDSEIVSVDIGQGADVTDPFVSAPVALQGMLVDCEPYGAYSSQLFFDTMTFGIDGSCRIIAPRTSRFTARYINFARNPVGFTAGGASVVWQSSFAIADGLRIDPHNSPALQALSDALGDADALGITVRWNAYRTIYFDDDTLRNMPPPNPAAAAQAAKLTAKLKTGGFQPNPARSVLVGVIGVWRKGEPMHEPGDRALLSPPNASPVTAHARAASGKIVIDLANSISETGMDLTKQDLGVLSVVAVDPASGADVTLGSFDYTHYDRDAYILNAGIVTVPFDSTITANIATSDLQIRDAGGNVLLAESGLRAIPLTPNLYLDEGDGPAIGQFQVLDRGLIAGAGITVAIYQMSSSGDSITAILPSVQTDSQGLAQFPVPTIAGGGLVAYVAAPGPNPSPPTAGIDPQNDTYMYARTRPADDAVAALPATWQNVYARVLLNWKAMAPCMDNWLDLADPVQVFNYGPMLKKLTDPANFETFRFMPVTRDMTVGERTLLHNFLDGKPSFEASGTEGFAATAPKIPSFAARSRALRGH